jgi:hypothetical protein
VLFLTLPENHKDLITKIVRISIPSNHHNIPFSSSLLYRIFVNYRKLESNQSELENESAEIVSISIASRKS